MTLFVIMRQSGTILAKKIADEEAALKLALNYQNKMFRRRGLPCHSFRIRGFQPAQI